MGKKKFLSVFVITSCLLVILSVLVWAHKPLDTAGPATRENPIIVFEHTVSWVAYNELQFPEDVHYYRLEEVRAGEKIHASMLIPYLDRLKNFNPILAVIGPGLQNDLNGLNQEDIFRVLIIEGEEGVVIKRFTGEEKIFYEPFSQTRYREKQELNILAPADGNYFVAVFDLEGKAEKYVLAIGQEEKWGFSDIIMMPKIWWDVRIFMERELATYITVGALVCSAIVITLFFMKK